jgi:hypothetical protein
VHVSARNSLPQPLHWFKQHFPIATIGRGARALPALSTNRSVAAVRSQNAHPCLALRNISGLGAVFGPVAAAPDSALQKWRMDACRGDSIRGRFRSAARRRFLGLGREKNPRSSRSEACRYYSFGCPLPVVIKLRKLPLM